MKKFKLKNGNLENIKIENVESKVKAHVHGGTYVGEKKDGLMDGEGTYYYKDGSKYTGMWKNDKMEGQGIHTWTTGEKYVGEWKDDE